MRVCKRDSLIIFAFKGNKSQNFQLIYLLLNSLGKFYLVEIRLFILNYILARYYKK